MNFKDLAYVRLASRDTVRTATLLGEHLGLAKLTLPRREGTHDMFAFMAGATPIVVMSARDGDRTGVAHLALACADPSATAVKAAAALGCTTLPHAAEVGGPESGLPTTATEGVSMSFAKPLVSASEGRGSGLIERIDHLGIVTASTTAAIETFHRRMGLALESQQIDVETQIAVESFTSDKYGAIYHTRQPAFMGGVRSAFITAGDLELEFLEDYNPIGPGKVDAQAAGTTRQDRGAIARFLAARGPGLAHIAFKTPDIAKALSAAERGGCHLIDRVGRPGGRRSQIAFIHPASTGGILMHFVERV